jgi:sortase (surface protein transpeptidase)
MDTQFQSQHIYIYEAPTVAAKNKPHNLFIKKLARTLAMLGIVSLLISFGPSFWYFMKNPRVHQVTERITETANAAEELHKVSSYQPNYDPSLPLSPTVIIPSIGVETKIHEATFESVEEALKEGVWRTPGSGTPASGERPIVLAAHRFGYLLWSNKYRRENSFYNLPKTREGDLVKIIWHRRKYIYAIYKVETSDRITDYSADLILYTCKALDSEIRVFRYARLLRV